MSAYHMLDIYQNLTRGLTVLWIILQTYTFNKLYFSKAVSSSYNGLNDPGPLHFHSQNLP